MELEESYLLNTHDRADIFIQKGRGAILHDADGKKYLDFAAGVAVNALGYSHPKMNKALVAQSKKAWHIGNIFRHNLQEGLAKRLCDHSNFADKAFFCSSGLEALEAAIKIARRYHYASGDQDRNHIITLKRGFHGRSLACLSAGGNDVAREGFGPLLDGFIAIEPNDIDALQTSIGHRTQAILLEPIQAEGGIHSLSKEYLQKVRQLATQYGALVIFDEVQCGYGRTGHLFHYKKLDIEPDILTLGKGIGGGFPLAACLASNNVAKCITPGTHGSTYGGNPLSMAVAHAILDEIEKPEFLKAIRSKSAYLEKLLKKLADQYPTLINEIRGEGLLMGIDLSSSVNIKQIVTECLEHGLVITKAGGGSVIRLTPPLIVSKKQIKQAYKVLLGVFKNI